MSATKRQLNGQKHTPCWSTYYDLGVEMNKLLPHYCTLPELGRQLGVSRQRAYIETVVALGKLVYHARKALNYELEESSNSGGPATW